MQTNRLAVILALMIAPSALTACGGSTRYTERPALARADHALTRPCDPPVKIPERDLTQADVERYWSIDRARLVRCRGEKAEVVRYYDDLFRRIGRKS